MRSRAIGGALLWLPVAALVVLVARTIVYSLAPPTLLALELGRQAGGPRLVVVCLVALGLGAAVSGAIVWLAAMAVAERRLLAGVSYPGPRLRLGPVLARAAGLWLATCVVFALLESTIHWREGLGFHGLHCLIGPVHRNAIPICAALSLLAAAAIAAARHVVAWLRRAEPLIAAARRGRRGEPTTPLVAPVVLLRALAPPAPARPRGPPPRSPSVGAAENARPRTRASRRRQTCRSQVGEPAESPS